ncbi:MAG: hypothetical protein DWQ47_12410 [Acidobacteria bacterium]|nr:MAG: hypothetical protein DWQ32_14825 [Acidobacteriota bacterium]REJ98371.1 MAG: hypothetical protein DWQ38_17625 [Acidobacteriota bacterium]REK17115.1 MAG: hypothetical protein DWQ43_02670 [Acidobacteriota bacterium]REK43025.1 MAG: hypothetical protein DWQ47_12410 [Acidobacteriota bacterium]
MKRNKPRKNPMEFGGLKRAHHKMAGHALYKEQAGLPSRSFFVQVSFFVSGNQQRLMSGAVTNP